MQKFIYTYVGPDDSVDTSDLTMGQILLVWDGSKALDCLEYGTQVFEYNEGDVDRCGISGIGFYRTIFNIPLKEHGIYKGAVHARNRHKAYLETVGRTLDYDFSSQEEASLGAFIIELLDAGETPVEVENGMFHMSDEEYAYAMAEVKAKADAWRNGR